MLTCFLNFCHALFFLKDKEARLFEFSEVCLKFSINLIIFGDIRLLIWNKEDI